MPVSVRLVGCGKLPFMGGDIFLPVEGGQETPGVRPMWKNG
jgi:hypothetical protein